MAKPKTKTVALRTTKPLIARIEQIARLAGTNKTTVMNVMLATYIINAKSAIADAKTSVTSHETKPKNP